MNLPLATSKPCGVPPPPNPWDLDLDYSIILKFIPYSSFPHASLMPRVQPQGVALDEGVCKRGGRWRWLKRWGGMAESDGCSAGAAG